jgi:hypothetical protein
VSSAFINFKYGYSHVQLNRGKTLLLYDVQILGITFSSLAKIIICPDVFIHLLKKLFQRLGGFLAKYWAIGSGRSPLIMDSITISFETIGAWALSQRTFIHKLSCILQGHVCIGIRPRIHLKTLKTCNKHIFKLFPGGHYPWMEGRIQCLTDILDCHDDGFCHHWCVIPIRRYRGHIAHRELLWSEWQSYISSWGGLYEGGWGNACNYTARGSIIIEKIIMVESFVPKVILVVIFIPKIPVLVLIFWLLYGLRNLCISSVASSIFFYNYKRRSIFSLCFSTCWWMVSKLRISWSSALYCCVELTLSFFGCVLLVMLLLPSWCPRMRGWSQSLLTFLVPWQILL